MALKELTNFSPAADLTPQDVENALGKSSRLLKNPNLYGCFPFSVTQEPLPNIQVLPYAYIIGTKSTHSSVNDEFQFFKNAHPQLTDADLDSEVVLLKLLRNTDPGPFLFPEKKYKKSEFERMNQNHIEAGLPHMMFTLNRDIRDIANSPDIAVMYSHFSYEPSRSFLELYQATKTIYNLYK